MNRTLRLPLAIALVCVFLALSSSPAAAQSPIISNGQAATIIVVFVAVVAGVTVLIYYAVRQPPSITGCAVAGPNGLTMQGEGDHQTYFLIGDTAAIHPGDRIKVKGKKKKKDSAGNRSFLVDNLKKDYGACPVTTP